MSKEAIFIVLFLVAWVALNRWVLPWLGVPTCMGGSCGLGRQSLPAPAASQQERVHSLDAKGDAS